MGYSDAFVAKVREANDIAEVVGQHTVLRNTGRSSMGLCPFPSHQEKTPSFSVSREKQFYHCFGCGKSGDIIEFLREMYGYGFLEAVEYLAKRAGVPLEQTQGRQNFGAQREQTQIRQKILEEALAFFVEGRQKAVSPHVVLAYLTSRGLGDSKLLNHLKIGWVPDSWEGLSKRLERKGFPLKEAAAVGLLRARKDSNTYYDVFRGRVIFPVFSFSGEVLGFGGRVLGDEKPKYINSPESEFFKKNKILYGQNWSGPFIREQGEAVVVEGYTDWIALYVSGFKNAVATMGTALTKEHTKKLKRLCRRVVCLFDGDLAGVTAAERALPHFFSEGLVARGVFLPDGEDPDSFLQKQGAKALQKNIKEARDLFLQLLDRQLEDYTGQPYEQAEVIDWAIKQLKVLPAGSSLQLIYLKELSGRLQMELAGLKAMLFQGKKPFASHGEKRTSSPSHRAPQTEETIPKVRVGYKMTDPEWVLFSLAMEEPVWQEQLESEAMKFSDKGAQYLWDKLKNRRRQNGGSSGSVESYLAGFCSNPEKLTLTLREPWNQFSHKEKEKEFQHCLHLIQKRKLKKQAHQLTQLVSVHSDEEDLKNFLDAQRIKRGL